MNSRSLKIFFLFSIIVLLFTFACNAPFLAGTPGSTQNPSAPSQAGTPVPNTGSGNNPSTPTVELSSTPPPINHLTTSSGYNTKRNFILRC